MESDTDRVIAGALCFALAALLCLAGCGAQGACSSPDLAPAEALVDMTRPPCLPCSQGSQLPGSCVPSLCVHAGSMLCCVGTGSETGR